MMVATGATEENTSSASPQAVVENPAPYPAGTLEANGNAPRHRESSTGSTFGRLAATHAVPSFREEQTGPRRLTAAPPGLRRTNGLLRLLGMKRIVIPSRKKPGSDTVIHIVTNRKGREDENDEDFPDDETLHIEARLQNKNGEFLDLFEETGEEEEEGKETEETEHSGQLSAEDGLLAAGSWWSPLPEELTDDMAFGIARNAFMEQKLEMPHPLVPVNGTGFHPEPILPEHMYPHGEDSMPPVDPADGSVRWCCHPV